jgi:hypothetical protein
MRRTLGFMDGCVATDALLFEVVRDISVLLLGNFRRIRIASS